MQNNKQQPVPAEPSKKGLATDLGLVFFLMFSTLQHLGAVLLSGQPSYFGYPPS